MPRVIHFEIHADNPERAVKFYEKVLGWTFQKWGGPMDWWLVTTGPDVQQGRNGEMGSAGLPPAVRSPFAVKLLPGPGFSRQKHAFVRFWVAVVNDPGVQP